MRDTKEKKAQIAPLVKIGGERSTASCKRQLQAEHAQASPGPDPRPHVDRPIWKGRVAHIKLGPISLQRFVDSSSLTRRRPCITPAKRNAIAPM